MILNFKFYNNGNKITFTVNRRIKSLAKKRLIDHAARGVFVQHLPLRCYYF